MLRVHGLSHFSREPISNNSLMHIGEYAVLTMRMPR